MGGRRFLAHRSDGGRYHVGIDLWANDKDPVVACEDGTIVAFYHFYRSTYALLVEHNNLVINYGEVHEDSLKANHLKTGDRVKAGQVIGFVGKMYVLSMLHFETYIKGTKANQRFMVGGSAPKGILNPTSYLLFLQKYGLTGAGQALSTAVTTVAPSGPRDWSKAIQLNRKYSLELGWDRNVIEINDLLLKVTGQSGISLGEEAFAEAVAAFQRQQGFSERDADGIIGPNTWRRMKPMVISGTSPVIPAPTGTKSSVQSPEESEMVDEQEITDEAEMSETLAGEAETIDETDMVDEAGMEYEADSDADTEMSFDSAETEQYLDEEAYEDQITEPLFSSEFDIAPAQGITDYLNTSAVEKRTLKTGIFIPAGYRKEDKVDLIVYFHGLYNYGNKINGIEYYWKNYSNIRACFAESHRNAVLLAPTLTSDPQQSIIVFGKANGFDNYVTECFKELKSRNYLTAGAEPQRIILAGHSAGGSVLRRILGGKNQLLAKVIECWGFDCLYNYNWESLKTSIPFYHYWAFTGGGCISSPGVRGEKLQKSHGFQNVGPKQRVGHQGIIEYAWRNEINKRAWFNPV